MGFTFFIWVLCWRTPKWSLKVHLHLFLISGNLLADGLHRWQVPECLPLWQYKRGLLPKRLCHYGLDTTWEPHIGRSLPVAVSGEWCPSVSALSWSVYTEGCCRLWPGLPKCTACALTRFSFWPETCENVHCEEGRRCEVRNGRARCVCAPNCASLHYPEHLQGDRRVCGSDERTYKNHCSLLKQNCRRGTQVYLDYYGRCQSEFILNDLYGAMCH